MMNSKSIGPVAQWLDFAQRQLPLRPLFKSRTWPSSCPPQLCGDTYKNMDKRVLKECRKAYKRFIKGFTPKNWRVSAEHAGNLCFGCLDDLECCRAPCPMSMSLPNQLQFQLLSKPDMQSLATARGARGRLKMEMPTTAKHKVAPLVPDLTPK